MFYCIEINIKLVVIKSGSKALEPIEEKKAEKQVSLGSKVIRQIGLTAVRIACVLIIKKLLSAIFAIFDA